MLSGIRVLDFTNQLGWIAGRILADLGADVVKVEPPDLDITDSAWQAHNLNKRSLALDITTKAGEEAVPARESDLGNHVIGGLRKTVMADGSTL